ncbi:histidine kinase [Hydrogenophaga sp. 2FB]|uniref:histidine kinase n=1 Tax=Hydrogenophaga sp. 2FB TaxID=2502187 RepID=UPI0010F94EB7|nr:histidine kinase [Hydrogenophaga sp. 2FB]
MTSMPTPLQATVQGHGVYLFASDSGEHAGWLNAALGQLGQVTTVALDERALNEHIQATAPRSVFLDFSGTQALHSTRLATSLRRDWPELLLIGTGHANEANTTLSALRAGVDDFLDLDGPTSEALPVLQDLMARRQGQRASPQTKGCTVALLGARAGLGVSTLACNLTALLQAQRTAAQVRTPGRAAHRQGVALLDLGLPARDNLLYLGLKSEFSFVDGVQNLHRLDTTLLQTALAQHDCGAAVLPLPANLAQIREISHVESVSLIQRLTEFFDVQVADLGGFSSVDFVAHVARGADKIWVVCDQSIGGIVSTAALLHELRDHDVNLQQVSLVVNKFEPFVNLTALDIANQLGLPLAHVLPARASALLAASCQGQLLARTAAKDPYVTAVGQMARSLMPLIDGSVPPDGADFPNRTPRMAQMLNKWIHRR